MFKQRTRNVAKTLIIFFALFLSLPPIVIYAESDTEDDQILCGQNSANSTEHSGAMISISKNVKTDIFTGTLLSEPVEYLNNEELFKRMLEQKLEHDKKLEEELQIQKALELQELEEAKLSTQYIKAGYELTYMEPHPDQSIRKQWMPYYTVTMRGTPQYDLNHLSGAYTGNYGIRMLGDAYMVALGSGYADYVGQYFILTFEDGQSILAVVGDFKSDAHTDSSHRIAVANGDLVEFITDAPEVMNQSAASLGSFHSIFQGNVVEIIKLHK